MWESLGTVDVVGASELVDLACRFARWFPHTAVPRSVRTDGWQSGAQALLIAARAVAGTQRGLIERVEQHAKQLVADAIIEPSNELADALQL